MLYFKDNRGNVCMVEMIDADQKSYLEFVCNQTLAKKDLKDIGQTTVGAVLYLVDNKGLTNAK